MGIKSARSQSRVNGLQGIIMRSKKYHLEESKTFCMFPWSHIHTWPNGNVYPCCMTPMDQKVGSFQNSSLKKLWNSNGMKKLRLNMLNEEKSKSCKRCYELEDSGGHSLRNYANKQFWTNYDLVQKTNINGSLDELNLKYWDFRFSNLCNFRCRSCGPQLSSAWFNDTEKLFKKMPTGTRQIYYSGGKPEKLWEEIQPLFDTVEEIYFAGGEPLLMEDHYRILKKLDEMQKYDVNLTYNTNFSELIYKNLNILDLWKKFKHVEVGASLDANHLRGEYMRKGQNWQKTIENRKIMIKQVPHVKFYINCTLSVMNSFNITQFHREWVEMGLIGFEHFHINLVLEPPHMRIQILPEHLKKAVVELYQNHIDNYLVPTYGDNIINIVNEFKSAMDFVVKEDYNYLLPKFRSFMKKLDNIRNENFIDVFPELTELYDE